MKGFAYTGNGMGWVDVPKPELKSEYDVLIKMRLVAPCTTDIEMASVGACLPGRILGHEGVGVIEQVGSKVKYLKAGDRVAVPESVPVFDSDEGLNGVANWSFDPPAIRMADPTTQGQFTEYVIHERADGSLCPLPDDVTDEQAVMLTDMIPTAYTGIDYLNIRLGETVAIIGIGPVGLVAVELAALSGASRIFAVGSRKLCVETAKKMGATDIIDYHKGSVSEQIIALNSGCVDKVLIAGGKSDIFTEAFRMCRRGGRIANIATFYEPQPKAITTLTDAMLSYDKEFRSLNFYSDRLRQKRCIELIRRGKLHPEYLVTHRYQGLENIEKAFYDMAEKNQDMIKPVVRL